MKSVSRRSPAPFTRQNATMSCPRRSTGPTRQLSLQQPAARRQQIRRQRSADEDKSLHVFASPATRGRLASGKTTSDRQKVRIAWEEKSPSKEKVSQVEVVARQISGRIKPTSAKAGKTCSEKASILYSRQELAERLRLAWKHRQEKRANIDIFLAHGTVEERCESRLSTPLPAAESPKAKIHDEKVDLNENYKETEDPSESCKENHQLSNRSDKSKFRSHGDVLSGKKETENSEDLAFEVNNSTRMKTKYFFHVYERQKRFNEISNTKENDSREGDNQILENNKNAPELKKEEKIFKTEKNIEVPEKDSQKLRKRSYINIDCTTGTSCSQLSPSTTILPSIKSETVVSGAQKSTKTDFFTAKQKRASFQSGTNQAFLIPMSEKSISSTEKVSQTKTDGKFEQKNKRTSSAPPQRRPGQASLTNKTQVNIVIDVPGVPAGQEKTEVDQKEQKIEETITKVSCQRAIRSAPLKRRSKSAKRRSFSSCKDDEDGHGRARNRAGGKGSMDSKTMDVVTMVSLVSSADSDSEIENSPLDDQLINQLRSKLPTTSIIKTSNNSTSRAVKKPIKSVSFQSDSFDDDLPTKETLTVTRDNKRIVQPQLTVVDNRYVVSSQEEVATNWRPEIPATNLPMLCLLQNEEEVPEAPLTDREKRCLVVPIGEIHDRKRKLLRTRNSLLRAVHIDKPSPRMDLKEQNQQLKVINNNVPNNQSIISTDNLIPKIDSVEVVEAKEEPPVPAIISEPTFQTTKEKECWHLYRRMCDKGVCVSFDTVLRGMLTPTEYRIRQKQVSQEL